MRYSRPKTMPKQKDELIVGVYFSKEIIDYYENRIKEMEEKYSQVIEERDMLYRELEALKSYIRELEREKEELVEKAYTDPLTGLLRRDYFDKLSLEHLRNMKYSHYSEPFSLVFCDLDNFKQINDKYGHLVGDEVLKTVSNSIKKAIRKNDYACRYGGDEFLLGLKCCDESSAVKVMERIYEEVENEINNSDNLLVDIAKNDFSMSGGIKTVYPGEIEEPIEEFYKKVVRDADFAAYEAKKHRDRTVYAINGALKKYKL